ncbi:transposase [Streptomyces scopuliridis]|uniref:transposase n=1 Tax=Streptomyces scopuliridis TaxID=452529 RepID=UPI0036CB8E8E
MWDCCIPAGRRARACWAEHRERAHALQDRPVYKTDLSDGQWALIEPVIAAWKAAHPSDSGHQALYGMREIVNALLCQARTGCQWDLLPHDPPSRGAVMYYFTKWRDDGTDQTIHDPLRRQVREKARRKAHPSPVVLDTQRSAPGAKQARIR